MRHGNGRTPALAAFLPAALLVALLVPPVSGRAEELPRPSYANSVIVSLEHSPLDADEVDYIKANLNFGLYAWLSFSITGIATDLAWASDWNDAANGIQAFKDSADAYIQAAKARKVRLHLVLISGLARYRWVYHDAKEEDIRNAQWFNDNKLCADANIGDPQAALDGPIWGTLSRYARKLRRNLEAKGRATLAFLRQRMTEEPDTLIALSGWGEAELSNDRLDHTKDVQDWFCDYSPFAVLEFRDWIQRAGMYDDASGAYGGQGYAAGGTKYQGTSGLALFNSDFGQSFTSWDLKYYNWSLADGETDGAIPLASYVHGGMMPTEGPGYIEGGFDPPRVMAPGNAYWDLWNAFREAMVHNFARDAARWASEAGIPAAQWFSHQIPADYLNSTNPSMMPALNARYFSSASPLSTADVAPYGSAGATIYDIEFKDISSPGSFYFVRTTQYGVPATAALSSNWAMMEYDAETYPFGLGAPQSTPDFILQQFLRNYGYRPHVINFFRWTDATDEHRIKGMNKEIALRNFVASVRDLGRNTDTAFVFGPPRTTGLSGSYVPAAGAIRLEVTGKIWDDLEWMWKDWGGFSRFEVFRGTATNVPVDTAHRIGTTTSYLYDDTTAASGKAYFYKVRAVNSKGIAGAASNEVMLYASTSAFAVLSVDKTFLAFGAVRSGAATPAQKGIARNLGPSGTSLSWRVSTNKSWLSVSPTSGTGDASLSVSVKPGSLAVGTYTGKVTVTDAAALNSPQTVAVTLKVYRSGRDALPFGSFDTPSPGATVMGSIPVTGWALDDLAVARVEVRRDPVAGDPPAAIGSDGLIFLGYATFVKGARPDVEAEYPAYPMSDRAGWGFQLLTYGLPAQGNGTFRIHAVAFDAGGKKKELGAKTITGDNAHNTDPFGAIDTPAQGGIASGANYVNFGWALTPQPKEIPRDGSTITVFVDSIPVGNSVYDFFRQDVHDAYPEYKNSDGPVGYHILDTTKYADGVHTISWTVSDDAGSIGGIGSRFFEIQNLSGASSLSTASGSIGSEAEGTSYVAEGTGADTAALLPDDDSERLAIEVSGGSRRTVREQGLVIVRLKGGAGRRYVGWGADATKGLPVGSTLDAKSGIFYWMPAPGFLGKHVLHFAATDGRRRGRPVTVVIDIEPKF